MHAVDQHHYPLQPDHGEGSRIEDGMADGEIDSIELEDSDAPLLLFISDQRRLGLTVTLCEQDNVYSASLKAKLVVTNMNGLLRARLLPKHLAMLGITDNINQLNEADASTASDLQVMSNEATSTTELPMLEPLPELYSEQQLAPSGADLDLDLSVATGCQTLKQDLQQ